MSTPSDSSPTPDDPGSQETGSQGPEMDDTQARATDELREELPPVSDEDPAGAE